MPCPQKVLERVWVHNEKRLLHNTAMQCVDQTQPSQLYRELASKLALSDYVKPMLMQQNQALSEQKPLLNLC